jgi:nucleoside-diphosphate-sugar epimerase
VRSLAERRDDVAASGYLAALDGKRIIVVGGTGVIGSNLCAVLSARRRARDEARTQLCSVSRTLPPERHRFAGVDYALGSVLDERFVRGLPDADYALYVAGTTSDYLAQPLATIQMASDGVHAFFERYASARACLVSSARIYGPQPSERLLGEDDPCTLPSPHLRNIYDGAKLVAEALALAAARRGQHVVIARLGNVYGPHHGRPPATSLAQMIEDAATRHRIAVTGPPRATRNHVFALDAVDGLLRALVLGRAGEAYNIGARDHLANTEVAARVAAAMPWPTTVEETNPTAVPDHMCLSIDKAARELGYAPACPASEGLPLTVAWTLAERGAP